MSDRKISHYAWIDVETTGLDHFRDPIIEFAMVITDTDLKPINGGSFVCAVDPGKSLLNARLEMSEFVRNMHTENGLLAKIASGHGSMTAKRTEEVALSLLASFTEQGNVMIAGSGVGQFDHPVLKIQMPELAQWFAYYPMDMGPIRRFIKYTLKRPDLLLKEPDPAPHRAMPDVKQSIAEAFHYRKMFGDLIIPGFDEEN